MKDKNTKRIQTIVRVVTVLFFVHVSLLGVSAQDSKNVMFNPVEHAVISQTIAPDARAAGMGDVGVATDPDVNSQYWNQSVGGSAELYAMAEAVGQRY